MTNQEYVDENIDLPWRHICKIACRAFLTKTTFNEVFISVIEAGLKSSEVVQQRQVSRKKRGRR